MTHILEKEETEECFFVCSRTKKIILEIVIYYLSLRLRSFMHAPNLEWLIGVNIEVLSQTKRITCTVRTLIFPKLFQYVIQYFQCLQLTFLDYNRMPPIIQMRIK